MPTVLICVPFGSTMHPYIHVRISCAIFVFVFPLCNITSAAAAKEGKVVKKGVKGETKEVKEVVLNVDVCLGANYFKTGEDPVIKAESEYPEWLWGLLDRGSELESKQHWRRLRKEKAHKTIASSMEKR